MENLQDYCAPGATYREAYYNVSDRVSLRLIHFAPPSGNKHPTIVFVPGWITLIASWQIVLREITREFPVIYIETREKISSKISGKVKYDVAAIGSDILQIISDFKLQTHRYLLFGSSLGATVLLDSCRQLRSEPLFVAVVGPNAEFRVPKWGIALIHVFYPGFYAALKPFVKWYLKNFRLNVTSDRAQYEKYCRALDAADPWKLRRAIIPFSKYKIWNFLHDIHYPVLIIGASKDKLHEPENLKKMVAILPNVTYIDLETNKGTHNAEMVAALHQYLTGLPNFHCDCPACTYYRSKNNEWDVYIY